MIKLFKILLKVYSSIRIAINKLYTTQLFRLNNVSFSRYKTNGIPIIVTRQGKCKIGTNFKMNNGKYGNPIGRMQKCILFVKKGAIITIGNNVGMSSTAIVSHNSITIGDNVKIGGGVCIYDTDFHSLDVTKRIDKNLDENNALTSPVCIKKNAFIGAHSTILKGVTIGENSIIGACSVVTKNVPDNQIWAGNPAKFIKEI